MKRVYNEKISPRANESLTRREHTVQTQKRVIVLVCVLVILAVILIGNSIITFAGSRAEQPVHKYYTSVQLQKGDSLWSLADQYAASDRTSRAQFIDEVCELNGISEDNTLHSGEYLVVSYYSPEIRYLLICSINIYNLLYYFVTKKENNLLPFHIRRKEVILSLFIYNHSL